MSPIATDPYEAIVKDLAYSYDEVFARESIAAALSAADVIATMGCGDACPIYPGKRYEDWNVADPAGQPIEVVREIRDDIQARVTTLLRQILS
jgi:protein-tyrosine-phosphatase